MKTEFEHKYDLNQEVWFMSENKPQSGKILSIRFDYSLAGNGYMQYIEIKSVEYVLVGMFRNRHEEELFATKDELLDSLR